MTTYRNLLHSIASGETQQRTHSLTENEKPGTSSATAVGTGARVFEFTYNPVIGHKEASIFIKGHNLGGAIKNAARLPNNLSRFDISEFIKIERL